MDHLQHRKEKNACDVQCNRSHESVREVINIELCMYLFMSVLSFQTRNYGSRSLRSHSCSFWDTISSFVLFSFNSLLLLPGSFSSNHAAVCHVIFPACLISTYISQHPSLLFRWNVLCRSSRPCP